MLNQPDRTYKWAVSLSYHAEYDRAAMVRYFTEQLEDRFKGTVLCLKQIEDASVLKDYTFEGLSFLSKIIEKDLYESLTQLQLRYPNLRGDLNLHTLTSTTQQDNVFNVIGYLVSLSHGYDDCLQLSFNYALNHLLTLVRRP